MNELQPMETAPRNGKILLSYWGETPVFIAHFSKTERTTLEYSGCWPFRKAARLTEPATDEWRVLCWSPLLGWGVNGGCAPFTPPGWMPLPTLSVKC